MLADVETGTLLSDYGSKAGLHGNKCEPRFPYLPILLSRILMLIMEVVMQVTMGNCSKFRDRGR